MLTGADIPATSQDAYLHDVDFAIKDQEGGDVSFHADNIQRGEGSKNHVSIDGTIQIRKEDGYLYQASGSTGFIEFKILRNYVAYNDTDYTGVPTIRYGEGIESCGGEVLPLNPPTLSDDELYYTYSAVVPGRFRLENRSTNALYVYWIKNTL